MKKLIITKILVVVTVLALIASFVAMIRYGLANLGDETDGVLVTYMLTLISFIVSVIALIVALKTFFSIDSVNSITSMEGNVLENIHYSVSYPEAIHALAEADDKEKFTDLVMQRMDCDRRTTHSCVEYADWLQKIIDNLVWLAYVDLRSDLYKNQWAKLKKTIAKELKKYELLSNGIQYVFHEHIKLIKYVMTYIEWSNEQDVSDLEKVSRLEDVRGGMIENPVSRTVYYDYLGLNYHKKARSLILKDLKVEDECSKDYYVIIYKKYHDKNKQDMETVKAIKAMLKRSIAAFDIASEASRNDLLWAGYIMYNKVRVRLLSAATDSESTIDDIEALLQKLDEVVSIREDIKCLYASKDSYLNTKLQEEINLAEELQRAVKGFLKEIKKIVRKKGT